MPHPTLSCGLDFGTSNSTIGATGSDGRTRLLPVEDARTVIPSAVFFDFETDRTLFGRRAVTEYVAGTDGRLLRALKSILGSQLADEAVRIKRQVVPFLDIVGRFVAELKQRAEAATDREIDRVVLGRPVHFVDDDPVADRLAQDRFEATVRAQGFHELAFQYEPIAAALDYEQQVTREELSLVVDLGGGTSDFSIVRVSPEGARATDRQRDILATAGVHLGGTDFDRMLSLRSVMPELGYQTPTADGKRPLPSAPYYDLATWHRINRLYKPKQLAELRSTGREALYPERAANMLSVVTHREGHRLAGAVEEAKIALTAEPEALVTFSGEEVDLAVPATRAMLAAALDDAIDRIADTAGAALQLAGLEAAQIDTLVLTGGSTQIPAIMTRLRALFPEARFVTTDAFGSVGLGLALDAKRKFG